MSWLRWRSAVDLLVLATAVYYLLLWTRRTRALRIAFGILALQGGSLVAARFDLPITRWVLQAASIAGVFALLVLFQPELRRAILRLELMLHMGRESADSSVAGALAAADAAFLMAQKRIGALIIIVNRDSIVDLVDGGVTLGAEVHREVIEAIFREESPLHDGAMVIDRDHIASAGVILPLTLRQDVPAEYGTRHRAAMGMAERCDAFVIVVSEERGTVTLMHGRESTVLKDPQSLVDLVQAQRARPHHSLRELLRDLVVTDPGLKLAAIVIAGLLWATSIYGPGGVVRVISVPIELRHVPRGMEVARQATTRLDVQLRGNPLLMETLVSRPPTARFDLGASNEGTVSLGSNKADVDVPPGVVVERVWPDVIEVELVRREN